jgi:enediyne biosynthesis protein E4
VNRIVAYFLFFVLLLSVPSCRDESKQTLFRLMENTGISFSNDLVDTKDFNVLTFRNFYNGGGVAIGDINNDGLSDVFFTANQGSNKLFLNKGNWQFEDISEKAGFREKKQWSTGVVMVDINHDGWLDIYVANSGHIEDSSQRANQLFINNRNLGFTDSAVAYGLADKGYTTHASFFDYDLDGDLDCFLINNSPIPVNSLNYSNKRAILAQDWKDVPEILRGGGDHLYRNDNGRFTEVTQQAGIHGSLISLGLGVTVGDVNEDGYPDLYISNDFFERDYLYINQRNGSFADELEKWVQHSSLASMGADIADVNNDGYPDIFTTDMLPDDDYRLKTTSSFDNIDVYRLKERSGFHRQFMQNSLQLNNGNGQFRDVAWYSGVAATDWSWGALMFDADNDGLQDILVCNGIYRDVTDQDFVDFFANEIIQKMAVTGKKEEVEEVLNKMPSRPIANKGFKNLDGLQFTDAGAQWGLLQKSFSNGAAYGDLDNDGDLDLVINNVNQPAFIYQNNVGHDSLNHYVGISLRGKGMNNFAVGSKIKIYADGQVISRELMPGRGFQSSVDYKTIIGLGARAAVDSLVIIWPDLTSSRYLKPAIDTVHVLKQPENSNNFIDTNIAIGSTLFELVENNFEKHSEDDYVDFYYERNIPVMLSREGPHAAVADVNADGLEDIYVGGAAGQAGQLYLQTATGFIKSEQNIFKSFADFEDVAVLFLDADGDKDQDLFIGSGGNHLSGNRRQLQHRLYLNDGKGNFVIDINAFPPNEMNIAVAAAADFDNDGDEDLFVGSRSVPISYGVRPGSYLYMNDGKGHFLDVTGQLLPGVSTIEMVTGAEWSDLTGDGRKELIIVGEWMQPAVFAYDGSRFERLATGLKDMEGLWQTVKVADIDGDGDRDLVLGNIGKNFYLRPSPTAPVKIWMNDFDNNGALEKILTRTIGGKDVPVFLKREMADQLPSLKKQNLKHTDFANKSINDLFPADVLSKAVVKQIKFGGNCVALNDGNAHFTIKEFPPEAQFSCINVIHISDINNDGKPDILTGGNKFGFQPQFGRLDACAVNLLRNEGNGSFSVVKPARSGLQLQGEVRDIVLINGKKGKYFLFLQNDSHPALFIMREE